MDERLRRFLTPQRRVHMAMLLFLATIIGWPLTHVLILLTHPPELAGWTGHLLLALSWGALTYTSLNIIVTTDVGRDQED